MAGGAAAETGALRRRAMRVILAFGVVSLFADMVYESARSVNGAYLRELGVDAAMVGIVVGLAQFFGAALRSATGYAADRRRAYWAFTIAGYATLATVPMMALSGIWQIAALLIIMEQFAKALRSPSKETILSQAAKEVGTGWGFGVHEAMDQVGATVGPLIFVGLFLALGVTTATLADFRLGYSLLWIPFAAMMIAVMAAYAYRPQAGEFEKEDAPAPGKERLSGTFWLYCAFVFLATLGFTNFVLVTYHLKARSVVPDLWLPVIYLLAMLVDGVVALLAGKLYDRRKERSGRPGGGVDVLVMLPLLAMPLPLMLFSESLWLILPAVVMWGAVMGVNESTLKAGVADLTSLRRRGTGFGLYFTVYGLALFGGSAMAGFLYEVSVPALAAVTVAVEAAAMAVLYTLLRRARTDP